MTDPHPRTNETPPRYSILTAIDKSDASDLALLQAWSHVSQSADRELHVVHVAAEPGPLLPTAERLEVRRRQHDALQSEVFNHVLQRVQAWSAAPLTHPMTIHVRFGDEAKAILQVAADVDADLLVVGSHGKSGLSHHFGSVSRKLLETARLPLLVSRPKELSEMRSEAKLEPPCEDCVAVRGASAGARWWCDVHGREHIDVHGVASTRRRRFAKPSADSGSMYA